MLIQTDGSQYPWLGDQVLPFTLLIAVDDATGTVANALFCEKEGAYTYFLQKERWKAIQKAMRKGMSLRAIERELGIHRATINKYMDADGPPGRCSRPVLTASTSDTVAP